MIRFLLILLFPHFLFAQEKDHQDWLNPTVMVIPFAKEGEQLRTIYEKEDKINLRVAVTSVKEAFSQQGISTIDFRAKIKQLSMDESMAINNQTSVKQRVIELSGADVYVEVEAAVSEYEDGSSVAVTATAYDAFSGQVLATNVGTTKKYYTFNFEKLTQKAVESFIDNFTKTIQEKFNKIVEEGRTISLHIGFDENADTDLDEEMRDGLLLSDLIESWVEENAYRNQFHIQGLTATSMIFDSVKIPVKDEKGRNFRATRFAARLRSFLKKQNLEVTRDVVGTKIYITIN